MKPESSTFRSVKTAMVWFLGVCKEFSVCRVVLYLLCIHMHLYYKLWGINLHLHYKLWGRYINIHFAMKYALRKWLSFNVSTFNKLASRCYLNVTFSIVLYLWYWNTCRSRENNLFYVINYLKFHFDSFPISYWFYCM